MKFKTDAAPAVLPKEEVVALIAKDLAAVRIQLAAAQAQLKAKDQADRYRLNFQVNALKKQAHYGKAQIARLKKSPLSEVLWP